MKHSACMQRLSELAGNDVLVVTNLSSNARMWSALRGERPSFYGLNMGLCLPFAVGVAIAFPKRRVVAIDGDGSLIIETSSLITAADVRPANLTAVVFDNGVYEVTGQQPTANADFCGVAGACGFDSVHAFTDATSWSNGARSAHDAKGPTFISLNVEPVVGGTAPHSPGPTAPRAKRFMEALRR